jgi:hypothetical protein
VTVKGLKSTPMVIYTYGRVEITFQYLRKRFDDLAKREELRERLTTFTASTYQAAGHVLAFPSARSPTMRCSSVFSLSWTGVLANCTQHENCRQCQSASKGRRASRRFLGLRNSRQSLVETACPHPVLGARHLKGHIVFDRIGCRVAHSPSSGLNRLIGFDRGERAPDEGHLRSVHDPRLRLMRWLHGPVATHSHW